MNTKTYILSLAIILLSSCNGSAQSNEAIENQDAIELFKKAQEESRKGKSGWKAAIDYLNQANEIEPNNPIILEERALLKINSKLDVEGGFEDHQKAIDSSTDSLGLRIRYNNRGLDYMDRADICSACNDWKKSGEFGETYIKKYCNREFDSTILNNSDSALVLTFALESPYAYISSTHNPPAMELFCNGTLIIENKSHKPIKLLKGILNYGLEYHNKSALFLEALDSNGNKYHFFKKGFSETYGGKSLFKLEKGMEFKKELDIVQQHHFSYPGVYQIRIGFRPSNMTEGLKKTYYSNWVELEVTLK